jgi:aspartokinase
MNIPQRRFSRKLAERNVSQSESSSSLDEADKVDSIGESLVSKLMKKVMTKDDVRLRKYRYLDDIMGDYKLTKNRRLLEMYKKLEKRTHSGQANSPPGEE